MASKTSSANNSKQRGEPKKTISVSSDSLSKYNDDDSVELIPTSITSNGYNQKKGSKGGKSQSQSSVNAAPNKHGSKASNPKKELSSLNPTSN